MGAQGPNPFAYIFPIVLLIAVGGYFGFSFVDRAALATRQGDATVTGKQLVPASTSYHTNVVAGRTVTQAQHNPESYVVNLQLGTEQTGGSVGKDLYDALQSGERVVVKYKRTRFSHRILVTDVSR